jgi:hypothetical protein
MLSWGEAEGESVQDVIGLAGPAAAIALHIRRDRSTFSGEHFDRQGGYDAATISRESIQT